MSQLLQITIPKNHINYDPCGRRTSLPLNQSALTALKADPLDQRERMDRKQTFLLIILIELIIPIAPVQAYEYPANQKDRGLILPIGMGEMALGPAWLTGNERSDLEANWNFRYGLTENLEIARLGFRYRILNSSNIERAIALQNYGLGYSESNGSFHHTAFSFEGKHQFNESLAYRYGIGYFWASSHEQDGNTHEYRYSIGAIAKISEPISIGLDYAYRDITGFSKSSANLLQTNLTINTAKNMDIVVELRSSDFSEAVDSVLFNESYDQLYSIQVNWRF